MAPSEMEAKRMSSRRASGGQAAEAGEPGERALDHPAVPARPLRVLDTAAAGGPQCPCAVGPAAVVVVDTLCRRAACPVAAAVDRRTGGWAAQRRAEAPAGGLSWTCCRSISCASTARTAGGGSAGTPATSGFAPMAPASSATPATPSTRQRHAQPCSVGSECVYGHSILRSGSRSSSQMNDILLTNRAICCNAAT